MSRGKDLAQNTLILSIGTFLPKLTALITIPIITSRLTKIEYGTYDLLNTLVSLLLPILTLQIHSAAFRFLIDCRDNPKGKKRVITNIYVFIIPISILALLIFYLVLWKINWQTRMLIILYFFADTLSIATQQVVRGISKNKLYSASAVIQSLIHMFLIVVVVGYGDKGINGVLISLITATGISIIFLVKKTGIIKEINFSLVSFSTIRQMLSYSWPMIPNTLSSWILSASDRFVLTGFMGLEAVAIYAAANKIPQLLTTVQGTFIFAWQENASLALTDKNVDKYYSDMFDTIFCILSGIMALLIGTTPILFYLLIKGDYSDAYPQMPVLFMGMFFSAISSFLGGIYIAHKRTKNVGITTMLAAGCNLVINLTTVQYIGIYAASISTLISYLLLAIYRMCDVKKFQNIYYNHIKIMTCIVILVIMCILCWFNSFAINFLNFILGCIFALFLNRKILIGIWHSMKFKLQKGN